MSSYPVYVYFVGLVKKRISYKLQKFQFEWSENVECLQGRMNSSNLDKTICLWLSHAGRGERRQFSPIYQNFPTCISCQEFWLCTDILMVRSYKQMYHILCTSCAAEHSVSSVTDCNNEAYVAIVLLLFTTKLNCFDILFKECSSRRIWAQFLNRFIYWSVWVTNKRQFNQDEV